MGIAWLVVFGEIEGYRWVVQNRRMAFTEGLCRRAADIRPMDQIVLYMSRAAFHNPTRDRSQLIGLARTGTSVGRMKQDVRIGDRVYVCGCKLLFDLLLPEREGVPADRLIPRLSFVRKPDQWGHCLRSGLIRLTQKDFALLAREVRRHADE